MNIQQLWKKLFSRNDQNTEIALHVAGATIRHQNPFKHLEVPRNTEELSQEFIHKWVIPFYFGIKGSEESIRSFAAASTEINIGIVQKLFGDFNWRTRITGAYFAAINNYKELEDIIGRHLLKSEVCYAGSGYCLALAIFGSDKAKDYLTTYLDYYLDRKDLRFDQITAFYALEYLDKDLANQRLGKWNSFMLGYEHISLDSYREMFIEFISIVNRIRQAKNEG